MIIFLATNGESIYSTPYFIITFSPLLPSKVYEITLLMNFFLFTFINYTMKLSAVIIVRNHYCLFSIGYLKN